MTQSRIHNKWKNSEFNKSMLVFFSGEKGNYNVAKAILMIRYSEHFRYIFLPNLLFNYRLHGKKKIKTGDGDKTLFL